MIRTFKSIFLAIAFIMIISFILPGCYTQFSRPRVDTEDEYYDKSDYEEAEEYYQDEGTLSTDDSRDVYIYNYYPFYGADYYDYWSWNYNPYQWGYIGPYPHHWWDPYRPWWTPGWYVGFSYYDYWSGGYPGYYDSYHRYGYQGEYTTRSYGKRPFDRRSIRGVQRDIRITDSQTSLAKPQSPTRIERPGQTLSTPKIIDKSLTPDRKNRTVKEMVDQRLRNKANPTKKLDNGRSRTTPEKRPLVTKPRTIKKPARQSKTTNKPSMIKQAPSKHRPSKSKKGYSPPKKSSNKKSKSISRPSNSSNTRSSKPSTPSYTPRRSSSSSSTRATTPRSSSSPSRSSRGSSSKSSGSSKTKK